MDISITIGILFGGFFVHVLLVCILAEISLGSPKIKDGILQIRKSSFVIENIYWDNVGNAPGNMEYPKNDCNLFWGIYAGTFHFVLFLIIGVAIMLFSLFCGFFINVFTSGVNDFEPYQTYRKRNKSGEVITKKFIAPWKFVAGFLLWYPFAFHFDEAFNIINSEVIPVFYLTIIVLFIFCSIACIIIIALKFFKNFFSATKEFLKSKSRRVCIGVDLVD